MFSLNIRGGPVEKNCSKKSVEITLRPKEGFLNLFYELKKSIIFLGNYMIEGGVMINLSTEKNLFSYQA